MLQLVWSDLESWKVPDREKVGYVLRAAALVQLDLRGNLAEVGGEVHVISTEVTGDPVLDRVLNEVATNHKHTWSYWVRHDDDELLGESALGSPGPAAAQEGDLLAEMVEAADPAAIEGFRNRVLTGLLGRRWDQRTGSRSSEAARRSGAA